MATDSNTIVKGLIQKSVLSETQAVFKEIVKTLEEKAPQRGALGLISQSQLRNELDISWQTLQRWKEHGLVTYKPPIPDTKLSYYKVSDVLYFLGVD